MSKNKTTSEVGSSASQFNMFREFIEVQNNNFSELIRAITAPTDKENNSVVLPKFNSELANSDVVTWCNTIDLIMADKPLEGSALIIALSASLEGEVAQWLSHVCYPGIKWQQFKEMIIQRFKGSDTTAATIINMFNSRPQECESISTYCNRLVSSFMAEWSSMNTEEIAVSVVLAHAAHIDSRLQRLLFTTNIKTRNELQQELKAFSFGKRKFDVNEATNTNVKKIKTTLNIKCHFCGKMGHKIAECRARKENFNFTPKKQLRKSVLKGSQLLFVSNAEKLDIYQQLVINSSIKKKG